MDSHRSSMIRDSFQEYDSEMFLLESLSDQGGSDRWQRRQMIVLMKY